MPNYAINPTPELDLRSNRAILPARVIAALDLFGQSVATPLIRFAQRKRAALLRAADGGTSGVGYAR